MTVKIKVNEITTHQNKCDSIILSNAAGEKKWKLY